MRNPADGPRRVLVIDDETSLRLLCRLNLEAEGMTVLEAADGVDGLAVAHAEHPDVILLDVMMPGLDGWDVAAALLDDEETSGIPIIFFSARAERETQLRGLDAGGVGYITKPFNPAVLGAAIDRVLERVERGDTPAVRADAVAAIRRAFDGR